MMEFLGFKGSDMRVLQITREVDLEELQEAMKRERHPKRRTWIEIMRICLYYIL
jgi:hypothetical protein